MVTIILVCSSYLWSKIQPELIYAIINGYPSNELKKITNLSFKNIILCWGFEIGLALAAINVARGFIFSTILGKSLSLTHWQLWLGLNLLLAGTTSFQPQKTYWKRWALYIGGIIPLSLELLQLSLAFFLALLLLTRHKKYLVWSSPLAGLAIASSWTTFDLELCVILLTCLTAAFGSPFPKVIVLVNNARQQVMLTKRTPGAI